MRSITIDELRNEVEGYIETAKSAKGDSAMRFLNENANPPAMLGRIE